MRKLIITFLILVLSGLAYAKANYYLGSDAAAPASCADTASGNYGKTYEDGTNANVSQYYIVLLKIDLGADAGENPTIHCYLADDSSDGQIKFLVYDDDGGSGEPGTLLYSSASTTSVSSSSFAWKTEVATGSGCLTGVVYVGFIAYNAMNPGLQYKSSDGVVRYINNGSTTPPASWNTGGDSHGTTSYGFYLSL